MNSELPPDGFVVPCSGSFLVGRRSSSSHQNRWGSGSGSCSGLIEGNRLRFWNRGTRPPDTKNSSARPDRWDSASTRHSAAVQCNSPSSPHREPPMVGRSRPPSEHRHKLNRPVHRKNTQTESYQVKSNETHLVRDVEPSGSIDLVGVEVNSELTGR